MLDAELLADFKSESIQIITELSKLLESLEEDHSEFPHSKVEEFAQMIDRIMGASNTLAGMSTEPSAFVLIGKLSGLGKAIGYKAAQIGHEPLLPVFVSFLTDAVEIIEELVNSIEDKEKTDAISSQYVPTLQKRLIWLGTKINDFAKNSPNQSAGSEGQISVDALLKSFGIS